MKRLFLLLFCICFGLVSCTDDPTIDSSILDNNTSVQSEESLTRAVGGESNFEVLPNPYALDVMQDVYDSYLVQKELEPTDLYVRFLPSDSLQLKVLTYDYDLELFSYPLDIDLPEDAVYVDPDIPEGDFTWLYTTVKPNFVFPQNIQYEILEQCYIPDEDESIVTTRGSVVYVEDEAFKRLGYSLDEEDQEPETRGKVRPQGRIRVFDNALNEYVPVKGVKIRCHRIIKWSTTYTNEDGYYTMDSKFRFRPHYAIVFDNCKGFDIWGNWGPLARANLNMGWHSNKGYSKNISTSNKAWDWAVVNNAGYDYYKMCEQTGISKPPRDIKIWVFKGFPSSSAPMLRRVHHPIGINGNNDWVNYIINTSLGLAVSIVHQLVKKVLPDITIGTQSGSYRKIYDFTNHELAHASHFSKVGSAFWARYISYIITNLGYGNGTTPDAELCGVGEMWGYAMGHIQENEKYDPAKFEKPYSYNNADWLKPHVFWDLYRGNVLTKKQIYDCLTADVDTYDKLAAKMYGNYPEKADMIEKTFTDNKIILNVTKPDTGDITHDAFYTDKTVAYSIIFSGNNILAQNVTVTNNAKLTFRANNSVTIDSPFTIHQGAQLEISCVN